MSAAKQILKYLRDTADSGLTYSPSTERLFNDKYEEFVRGTGQEVGDCDLLTFSDADHAGSDSVELRSTSGTITFWRSFPIAWQSKRQSLR